MGVCICVTNIQTLKLMFSAVGKAWQMLLTQIGVPVPPHYTWLCWFETNFAGVYDFSNGYRGHNSMTLCTFGLLWLIDDVETINLPAWLHATSSMKSTQTTMASNMYVARDWPDNQQHSSKHEYNLSLSLPSAYLRSPNTFMEVRIRSKTSIGTVDKCVCLFQTQLFSKAVVYQGPESVKITQQVIRVFLWNDYFHRFDVVK